MWTWNKVRIAVEFILGHGDRPIVGEIGLTTRAKRVIELSIDETRRMGHHYVGSEHLLVGMVHEGEGIAAGVLQSLGVTLESARTAVLRAHAAGQSEDGSVGVEQAAPVPAPTREDRLDAGDLERVLPVSLSADDATDHIELSAIEVRVQGLIAIWAMRPLDGASSARGTLLAVRDDQETTYGAETISTEVIGQRIFGRTLIVPRPDASVGSLVIRFVRIPQRRLGPTSTDVEMNVTLGEEGRTDPAP